MGAFHPPRAYNPAYPHAAAADLYCHLASTYFDAHPNRAPTDAHLTALYQYPRCAYEHPVANQYCASYQYAFAQQYPIAKQYPIAQHFRSAHQHPFTNQHYRSAHQHTVA
jgi:hypothetical protein